jgi:hypothetical protein
MQVDRSSESLRALPEPVELRIIEIFAVGMAVDQSSTKSEVAYAPFQIVRGRGGILHRKMRKTGVATRLFLDFASPL